jgi:hypothetical protein
MNDNLKTIWDILIQLADNNDVISYSELKNKFNDQDLSFNMCLKTISDYCKANNLPTITFLVMDENNISNDTFYNLHKECINNEIFWIYDFEWNKIKNPFVK